MMPKLRNELGHPKDHNGRTTEELIALLSAVASAILVALFIAALYFGREIFVPIALAILLSFVLAPLVGLLQRARIPRAAAVVSIVVLAFMIIFGLGTLIANQLSQLAGDLPVYQSTMREKIKSVRGATASSGTLERAADMLQELSRELDKPKDDKAGHDSIARLGSPNAARTVTPVPVEVRQPDPGALENLRSLIAPLLSPLATTGIIIIFVIFILIQREDLRNRLIRLAGSHDLQRTTAALDDAATRLSRLFLAQLMINATFGVTIGVGLSFIGVPSAILWGILAAVLRFVPYIGSAISAAFRLPWQPQSIPVGRCWYGPSRFSWASGRSSARSSNPWLTDRARGFRRSRSWSPRPSGPRYGDLSGWSSQHH
jgi:predicted PurR-regulated permease PerM